MATIRFGLPKPGDAEQVVVQARKPRSAANIDPDEWRSHFPYGVFLSPGTVSVRDVHGSGTLLDISNGSHLWHVLNHPDSGLRANGLNYIMFNGMQPYNFEVVQNNTADTIEAPSAGPQIWQVASPVQRLSTVEDGLNSARWFGTYPYDPNVHNEANALDLAGEILAIYADNPSVLAYNIWDDVGSVGSFIMHVQAGIMVRAMQSIDPRPASASFVDSAAVAEAGNLKLVFGPLYPCGRTAAGVDTAEGDLHRPSWSGSDYADFAKEKSALAPPGGRYWMIAQAHQTEYGGNSTSLRYPTPREMRKIVWMTIGSGCKGLFWFVYVDQPPVSEGLGSINSRARLEVAAEMGHRLTPAIRAMLIGCDNIPVEPNPFTATGGELAGIYPNAYISTLSNPVDDYLLVVVCNNGATTANVTISSATLSGTLVNLETGDALALGDAVTLPPLDGTIYRFVPESAAIALYWLDDLYDQRFTVFATNDYTEALHDQVVTAAIPSGASIDTGSLTVIETTDNDSIDRPYAWRYGDKFPSLNTLLFNPATVSGGALTFKVLGRWKAGETRRFSVYWDSTSTLNRTPQKHLGKIGEGWQAVIIAGTTGDSYVINAGGATYTHVMTAGQTAAQIGLALKALINAGAVAISSGGGSVQTVASTDPNNLAFTVTNTGSTVPGNITIVPPTFLAMGRTGPDLVLNTQIFGFPYGIGGTFMTRPGWSHATGRGLRTMSYPVDGVGTFVTSSGTLTSVVDNGPSLTVAGTLVFPTRSGNVDWTGSYTAEVRNVFFKGRKSDNTNPDLHTKSVDVARITLTYVCNRAYTPTTIAGNVTAASNFDLITLGDLDGMLFPGNSTEAAANKIPYFSAPLATGAITPYAASANLAALPVTDTIIGNHGNINCIGVLVNNVSLTNFGSQAPEAKWCADTSAFARLQLRNVVNTATIPVGATITVDFWLALNTTGNALTEGDVLLPDELVTLMRGLRQSPSIATTAPGAPSALTLPETMLAASDTAVEGCRWFRDNSLALTNVVNNSAYQYHTAAQQLVTVGGTPVDDHDGNYGEAFKLHGLCLYYLRTHDPTVIDDIEAQVQFHIQIEQDLVAQRGSYWAGSAPYWYWPSVAAPTIAYTAEGFGDPNFNGGAGGTIVYQRGDVRMWTSIDQAHMVAHALYAYLYLLRNEPAITANTTVRADALALLSRMATFETDQLSYPKPATSQHVGNLYRICQGLVPDRNIGITDATWLPSYKGQLFNLWQENNQTGVSVNPSSNSTIDLFFGAVWAPNSQPGGVINFLRGRAMDMLTSDLGLHDVTWHSSYAAGYGAPGPYPKGWMLRAAAGDSLNYAATRTVASNNGYASDLHWIDITNSALRDTMTGRAPQRLIVLCLLALMDPTYEVPVEMTGGTTVVRTVPIWQAINDCARTMALYLPEPTTNAIRYSASSWLGDSDTYHYPVVDSAFTGYWMMAVELWHLVNSGASYADYYPIGTW